MPWDVSADPDAADKIGAWFKARKAVTKAQHEELTAKARERSFTIGGTVQLRVVQTILSETTRAAAAGQALGEGDFETFKERLRQRLKSGYVDKNSARLKAAFATTTQKAYGAARWDELNSPEMLEQYPYRIYDSILDAGTTPLCRGLNATVRRSGDDFWLTHWPPCHMGCRGGVRGLTARQGRGRVTRTWSWPAAADGFGRPPAGDDSDDDWQPDPNDFDPRAFSLFERKRASMLAADKAASAVKERKQDDAQDEEQDEEP
jgi:hypothetical protein